VRVQIDEGVPPLACASSVPVLCSGEKTPSALLLSCLPTNALVLVVDCLDAPDIARFAATSLEHYRLVYDDRKLSEIVAWARAVPRTPPAVQRTLTIRWSSKLSDCGTDWWRSSEDRELCVACCCPGVVVFRNWRSTIGAGRGSPSRRDEVAGAEFLTADPLPPELWFLIRKCLM
jgi:hypothetical protein